VVLNKNYFEAAFSSWIVVLPSKADYVFQASVVAIAIGMMSQSAFLVPSLITQRARSSRLCSSRARSERSFCEYAWLTGNKNKVQSQYGAFPPQYDSMIVLARKSGSQIFDTSPDHDQRGLVLAGIFLNHRPQCSVTLPLNEPWQENLERKYDSHQGASAAAAWRAHWRPVGMADQESFTVCNLLS
jgi:hypothetical protein